MDKIKVYGGAGVVGVVVLMLLSAVLGCFYTVDQRARAVVLRNGAVVGEADPGLHWKLPFVDGYVLISTESHRVQYQNMEAYSRDQQPARMDISVNYSVPPARVSEVYARYSSLQGLVDRVIRPKVYEQAKNVFGQFDAVTAVQDRVKLNAEIAKAIHENIGALQAPLTIEAVQIENIEFSPEYMKSIEQRMQAAVEVDRLKQNALREQVQAQIAVTQAQGRADALRAQAKADGDAARLRAEGDAAAIRARGDAEASAIQARAKALGDNPNLVTLTTAERWDGKLPATMVPGAGVPLIDIGRK